MNNRGISTIELMVALALITMAITASIFGSLSTFAVVADADSEDSAIQHARDNLATNTNTTTTELEDAKFFLHIATMDWITSRGQTRSIKLSSISNTVGKPETCDPFTSGNWSQGNRVAQYLFLNNKMIPGTSGTHSISSLALSTNSLTVAMASTSLPNTPNVFFFSLSGTSTPMLIGSFDTSTTSRIGNSAVVMDGTYAFVGNAFNSASSATCSDGTSCAQINVFTLTEASASLVSSFTLSTSSAPYAYTIDGAGAPVASLAYANRFLYLGLQKTVSGDEFNIIDAQDPLHLHWVSGYPIGRTVNNIFIRDERAYVSTDDPTRELMIFDIHDPTHPIHIADWDSPGPSTFGYGSVSSTNGSDIRFGTTYSPSNPEFELLKISDSGSLSLVSSLDVGNRARPQSVNAILTQDRLTFVLLKDRCLVLDTHDPTHIAVIATLYIGLNRTGVALACRNNQIYIGENMMDGSGAIEVMQGA